MSGDADLEFGLRWNPHGDAGDARITAAVLDADPLDTAQLEVDLRFQHPSQNIDRILPPVDPVSIDLALLRSLSLDEEAYGKELTRMVLASDDVRGFFEEAIAVTEGSEVALHLRMHINAPPQFHGVRWESLRIPRSGKPVATASGVLLSRYLTSPDWRPIPSVARHDLRALIVVAGPSNIGEYTANGRILARVRVDQELSLARSALTNFRQVTELAQGRATLANLLEALENEVDVLYMVCHGALLDRVPVLYLERADGSADRVDGRKLVERITGLPRRPTVVLLSSCQSASNDDESTSSDQGELSALGPRLAGAGVSAVVAMQGNVTMVTAREFSTRFFKGLSQHGVVDRAMASARRAVRARQDWWAPVLFSRLRSGRTYYKPQFTERADATWETIRLQLRTGYFTPVLGPGLADAILGSRQNIARRWVKRWQMPLSLHNQEDLAQVAQYLRVLSGDTTVRAQFVDYLGEEITRRSEEAQPGEPFWNLPIDRQKPADAITEIGRRLRNSDPGDPYRVAAGLPVDLYVTTGVTDLLQSALRERDPPRDPTTLTFPWNESADVAALQSLEPPTYERPLVYHLFGRLERPRSLVLTEDDYFEWMAAWHTERRNIPTEVSESLVAKSLMFVGFRLDDWDFRVVFDAIKSFGGHELFTRSLHVGVQLSPDSQLIEPEAAQEYFESYFGNDKVSIYWGDTRQFLDEFRSQTGL